MANEENAEESDTNCTDSQPNGKMFVKVHG